MDEDILDYIDEVTDSEVSVEEYSFWNHTVHGKGGNQGLSNFVGYLAVYEDDSGELTVDKELIDRADRIQAEADGISPKRKKKYQNIADRLKRNGVKGHSRLQNMVEEFRKEADVERSYLTFKDDLKAEGETTMAEFEELENKLEELEGYIQDLGQSYNDADSSVDEISDTLSQIENTYEDIDAKVRSLEGSLSAAESRTGDVFSALERADTLLDETYQTIGYFADNLEGVAEDASELAGRLDSTREKTQNISNDLESLSERDTPTVDLPDGIDELVDKYGDEETQEAVEGIRSIRDDSDDGEE